MPAPFKWTEEKRREMIAAYENGEGTNAIAKRFHLGHESVASLLHEQGIILRSHSEYARRHICNHSYFHSITTEAQAYWLGFLTADGCITTGNRINIVLGITDCSHLSKLKEALEASQKVSLSNRSCSFAIGSPEMAADLAIHGILPKKTFSTKPAQLPLNLLDTIMEMDIFRKTVLYWPLLATMRSFWAFKPLSFLTAPTLRRKYTAKNISTLSNS